MSFNIAFFADSHIGYKAPRVPTNSKNINVRVQDGYDAFRDTVGQILRSETKIDAVVHGGDLFHTSRPSPRDEMTVRFFLDQLAARGIPFYGIAGNHDATDTRGELAAVAVIDDPSRLRHALYKPYEIYELADGIVLHAVSHHGLSEDAPEVVSVEGAINLFTTHGVAFDPKNRSLLRCEGAPREQIIPLELVIDDGFVAKLLGHYHSRYAVGSSVLNTWYAGSAIRRGFSDDPGPRGWLLVKIDDNGQVKVTAHDIPQRPQFDLDLIDADGMNAKDVMDLLEINMGRTLDVDHRPIVRQRITNASHALRQGLDQKHISELAAHMLSWSLEYPKGDFVREAPERRKEMSLANRHSINIMDQYEGWWMDKERNSVPEEFRDVVDQDIRKYLTDAREQTS